MSLSIRLGTMFRACTRVVYGTLWKFVREIVHQVKTYYALCDHTGDIRIFNFGKGRNDSYNNVEYKRRT